MQRIKGSASLEVETLLESNMQSGERVTCQGSESSFSLLQAVQTPQAPSSAQSQGQRKPCQGFMAGMPPLGTPLQALAGRLEGIVPLPRLILQLCQGFPASSAVCSRGNAPAQGLHLSPDFRSCLPRHIKPSCQSQAAFSR